MIWLVAEDGEKTEVAGEVLEALYHACDHFEIVPTGIGVFRGERGGEAMRGLRVDVGGVRLAVVMPEEIARRIGTQLADGGVVRASAMPT